MYFFIFLLYFFIFFFCRNAKGCNAVRHCIQTVWEKHQVPVDNDSICQICKDMVTQARDQLRSNETMEELKEVFEGSCNLIPIKIVKKECCKLADNFIPELVEALSSQMNPDVSFNTNLLNIYSIHDIVFLYTYFSIFSKFVRLPVSATMLRLINY